MKAWAIVVLLVIAGIIAGWVRYWVGHALGWSTGAEFPFTIGGGAGAIGLSILVSFGTVMAGAGWLIARPPNHIRTLAPIRTPGHATIRRAWRTGIFTNRLGGDPRHQVDFELDMHPYGSQAYIATATGLLTEAKEAVLTPGAESERRVDPSHPSSVVVGPMAAG